MKIERVAIQSFIRIMRDDDECGVMQCIVIQIVNYLKY